MLQHYTEYITALSIVEGSRVDQEPRALNHEDLRDTVVIVWDKNGQMRQNFGP